MGSELGGLVPPQDPNQLTMCKSPELVVYVCEQVVLDDTISMIYLALLITFDINRDEHMYFCPCISIPQYIFILTC